MTTDNDEPQQYPPPTPGDVASEDTPGAGFSVVPASSGSRTRRISHDQYFKSLITQYPRQALALFDPARFASLDDSVVITPLRQELPPDRLGERFFELDIPLEVRWPDGSRETMVILIEHQTIPSRFRIKKLLTYYVNLSEVLHTDIITPIVIFLRDGRDIPVRLDMGPLDRRHAFFDYIPVILPRWKAIDHLGDLKGKRVLVRSDFNVPLDADKNITDDGRIQAALPTLRTLLDAGAKVIITAHLGRPKGQVNPDYSLAPVAKRLAEVTGVKVTLAEDTVGESAKAAVAAAGDGEIVLLENVRFNAAETSKDDAEREAFAAELAALADVFVSDGFGVVHRKQASVYDVAKLLPSAAGLLVVKEIESLGRAVNDPERPYTVVLGGSKVSDKLGVISNLLSKADRLLIGGGMAYTFLAAQGYEVGTSLLEKDQIDTVKGYLETAKANGVELLLPVDTVVAPTFAADAPATVVPADALPADQMGLDIGPETRKLFAEAIATSKTVVWNGPMGVFEFPAFAEGTKAVAKAISESDAFSVIGGGDSAAAVRTLGFDEATFSHISTGGGASLELLEGKTLPGIAVLND